MTHAQRRENLKRAMRQNRAEIDLRTVACDQCGVKLRSVPVSDAQPSRYTSAHMNGRRMGVLGDQPTAQEVSKMPTMHYVEEDPNNVLRRRIQERSEAIAAGRL